LATCWDYDGDGYLDAACGGDDCDDADPGTYPGAPEKCDGLDNDCDGVVPFTEWDLDHDSYMPCQGDCCDINAFMYPGALELCNGRDDNCNGRIPDAEKDQDGDGYVPCILWLGQDPSIIGSKDCDDANPDVHPGAQEICNNGINNDCDDSTPDECDPDKGGRASGGGGCMIRPLK